MNECTSHVPRRLTCDCPACTLAIARKDPSGRLPLFVVYNKPSDEVAPVVVRLWLNNAPTTQAWGFEHIDDVRRVAERLGLIRLLRDPSDDPVIVESWL